MFASRTRLEPPEQAERDGLPGPWVSVSHLVDGGAIWTGSRPPSGRAVVPAVAEPGRGARRSTEMYRRASPLAVPVTRTVDDLRNEIRQAVGRYERVESTAFTKEALAALCTALDYDIDTARLPSKAQMRAGILWRVGVLDEDDPDSADRPFRKAELESIAAALRRE